MKRILFALLVCSFATLAIARSSSAPEYKEKARFVLGGEGGWDCITYDPAGNRIFIAHNKEILVVDAATGKKLGSIPAEGAHGVAIVGNKGFSTNGKAGTVTVFDTQTLKTIQDVKAGDNPDVILFDPYSKRVIVMNGRSKDIAAIDPETLKVTATVAVGGKPEFAAATKGHIYVNAEDTSEIVDIDSKQWKVTQRWKLPECEEPSGLAMDPHAKRLFTTCGNKKMLIIDGTNGKLIDTVPTGDGTDGAAFDPATGLAFSSNGEGTLTVVHKAKNGHYEIAQNLSTQKGARTLALDPKTHEIFTVTAEFGPQQSGERRPPIKPGTLTLLVYAPSAR